MKHLNISSFLGMEGKWLYEPKNKNTRLNNSQICAFLMNQKYFSGLGLYLCCEILYLSKIKPDRILSELTDDEIKELFDVILTTVKRSYDSGGHTIKSYISPD